MYKQEHKQLGKEIGWHSYQHYEELEHPREFDHEETHAFMSHQDIDLPDVHKFHDIPEKYHERHHIYEEPIHHEIVEYEHHDVEEHDYDHDHHDYHESEEHHDHHMAYTPFTHLPVPAPIE